MKDSLRGLPGEPTLIASSRRITPLLDADRVVLVLGGRFEAIATHEELLVSSADYRDLVANEIAGERRTGRHLGEAASRSDISG